MGKHTAGPWKVGRTIATTGVMPIKSGHSLIAHVTHPKWGYEDTPQDESECLANAALISASPTMYEFILRLARNGNKEAQSTLDALNLGN